MLFDFFERVEGFIRIKRNWFYLLRNHHEYFKNLFSTYHSLRANSISKFMSSLDGRKVGCYKGCCKCCDYAITATTFEVINIGAYLARENLKLIIFLSKIDNYLKKLNQLCREHNTSFEKWWEIPSLAEFHFVAGISCPFLFKKQCLIESVKPIVCYGHFSFSDPEMCSDPEANIYMHELSLKNGDYLQTSQPMPVTVYRLLLNATLVNDRINEAADGGGGA